MSENGGTLSALEVEAFARGLYYIASQDGIEASEEKLLSEFIKEAGVELRLSAMGEVPTSPAEVAQLLDKSYLRRIFMKAAIAMVRADGVYSDAERRALGEFADAFGLTNAEFGDIEQQTAGLRLE